MDIYMIWAIVPDQPNAPWLVGAWDEECISENNSGWLEALADAEKECGGRFIRIVKTSVDYGAVTSAFHPVSA